MRVTILLVVLFVLPVVLSAQVEIKPVADSTVPAVSVLLKNKEYAKALAEAKRWVENEPAVGKHYFNRAVCRYYQEQYHNFADTAIMDDCFKAMDLGYDHPEVYYLLFAQHIPRYIVRDKEVTYADAKTWIDQAIQGNSDERRYLQARINFFREEFNSEEIKADLRQFEFDLKRMVEKSTNATVRADCFVLLSDIELYKKQDSTAALSYLSDALALQPQNPEYRYYRAELKYGMNDDAGAISDYTIYLKLKSDPDALVNRGVCFMSQQENAKALSDLNQAIALYEKQRAALLKNNSTYKLNYHKIKQSRAYRVRGLIYQQVHNKTKGCADLSKALELGDANSKSLIEEYCR